MFPQRRPLVSCVSGIVKYADCATSWEIRMPCAHWTVPKLIVLKHSLGRIYFKIKGRPLSKRRKRQRVKTCVHRIHFKAGSQQVCWKNHRVPAGDHRTLLLLSEKLWERWSCLPTWAFSSRSTRIWRIGAFDSRTHRIRKDHTFPFLDSEPKLYFELFVQRYKAAKKAGFQCVETGFPYSVPAQELAKVCQEEGLQQVFFQVWPIK